jgi:CDP-diacylglycerol--glycerol-3-phosphate 3-phosphatidyltransferase
MGSTLNFREIFYASNLLSISRILLLIPIYLCLQQQTSAGNYATIFLILLGAATDFWDGRLARSRHEQSDLGRILDPVADKICVAILAILMYGFRDLPLWYVGLLLLRDLLILVGGLLLMYKTKLVVESNWPGKITVGGLAVVIMTYTLDIEVLERPFLWISVGMVLISSLFYVIKMVNLLRLQKVNGYQL